MGKKICCRSRERWIGGSESILWLVWLMFGPAERERLISSAGSGLVPRHAWPGPASTAAQPQLDRPSSQLILQPHSDEATASAKRPGMFHRQASLLQMSASYGSSWDPRAAVRVVKES